MAGPREVSCALLRCVLVAAAFAACAGDPPVVPDEGSVELAGVVGAPTTVSCFGGFGPPPTYDIVFDAQLVNTTAVNVSVTGASAWGAITWSARDSSLLGRPAHVFASLPFTPVVARAHDGDVETRITLHGMCSALPPPGRVQWTS